MKKAAGQKQNHSNLTKSPNHRQRAATGSLSIDKLGTLTPLEQLLSKHHLVSYDTSEISSSLIWQSIDVDKAASLKLALHLL